MLHSKNANYIKVIFIFIVLILISSILFLTLGIHKGNLSYALSQRVPKLIAIIFTGSLIAFSTILFQTTTDNRLLTPNVMGLDSFYVLIQTTIVFLFGSTHLFIVSKKLNFLLVGNISFFKVVGKISIYLLFVLIIIFKNVMTCLH